MKLTNQEGRELLNGKRKKPVTKWQTPKLTESQPNAQILVGIDPGSVVTGFAIVREGEPPILKGFKSHCEAILFAQAFVQQVGRQNIHFVVEDARKAKKNGYFAKLNGSKKDQGVGYVKGLSKDWEQFCKRVAKVPYTLTAPNPAITKWTAKRFELETGIKTLETEHHLRDAFNLLNYRNAI